jgi:hypothetical protein
MSQSSEHSEVSDPRSNIQRAPRFSRLLGIGMIGLAAVQVGAAARALTLSSDLAAVVSVARPLDFVAAVLWGIAFSAAGVLLLRKSARRDLLRRWNARRLALVLLGGFALYSLARLAVFAQADYDRGRLPFLIIITALFLLLVTIFYGVAHDPKPKG